MEVLCAHPHHSDADKDSKDETIYGFLEILLEALKKLFDENLLASCETEEVLSIQNYFTIHPDKLLKLLKLFSTVSEKHFTDDFLDTPSFNLMLKDMWLKQRVENGKVTYSLKQRQSKANWETTYVELQNEKEIILKLNDLFQTHYSSIQQYLEEQKLCKYASIPIVRYDFLPLPSVYVYIDKAQICDGYQYIVGGARLSGKKQDMDAIKQLIGNLSSLWRENLFVQESIKFPARSKVTEYLYQNMPFTYSQVLEMNEYISTSNFYNFYVHQEKPYFNIKDFALETISFDELISEYCPEYKSMTPDEIDAEIVSLAYEEIFDGKIRK